MNQYINIKNVIATFSLTIFLNCPLKIENLYFLIVRYKLAEVRGKKSISLNLEGKKSKL